FLQGYLTLGELLVKGGKNEAAEKLYAEAVRHNPNAIPARERLVDLHMRTKDFDAAEREREAIAKARNREADWLELGNVRVLNGKIDGALEAYRKAAQVAPQSWEPHYNLGQMYDVAHLNEDARREYQLSIQHNRKSFKPHNGMGLLLLRENRVQD